jgi:hypothetical protein
MYRHHGKGVIVFDSFVLTGYYFPVGYPILRPVAQCLVLRNVKGFTLYF